MMMMMMISKFCRLGYVGKSPHASNLAESRVINDADNDDDDAILDFNERRGLCLVR